MESQPEDAYKDLLYVRRRFLSIEDLRQAIAQIVNETLAVRLPQIWGEATTACASDSKQFGAWDQNLLTEWHLRNGGRGVMVYWHIEKNAACIYSQLKRVSSSKVAAMLLRAGIAPTGSFFMAMVPSWRRIARKTRK